MASDAVEKEKKSGLIKKTLQLCFSHIGLCLIVIIYCVIGGLLFELLEKENEITACKESRKEYDEMENETLFSLLDVVLNNPLGSNAAEVQLIGVFESFRNNSFSIGYEGYWCEGYGTEDGPSHEWTFAGGLFFSMTVITTIGYGHISPKTVWGRLLCISYAMLGIPLMLMFLTNIGDVLADVFRYVYCKIICLGCLRGKKKQTKRPSSGSSNEAFIHDDDRRSNLRSSRETSKMDESEIPADLRRTVSPSSASGKFHSPLSTADPSDARMKSGSSSTSTVKTTLSSNDSSVKLRSNSSTSGNGSTNFRALDSSALAERGKMLQNHGSAVQKQQLVLDEDSDDDDDEAEWESISKVCVPLTVSMAIIGLYIFGGAILFKYWEGWDMLQSSYFCFITLSTIGFGDVTPGRDFNDPLANARLIIGTVYSVFGMAILSMCFTLMQEEMVEKVRWIGRKLGIVENEDDELDSFTEIQKVNDKPT